MELRKRYDELLRKREKALERIKGAKEALGSGSWHEDANYDLADVDLRVYEEYLRDIEDELKDLSSKLGPKV